MWIVVDLKCKDGRVEKEGGLNEGDAARSYVWIERFGVPSSSEPRHPMVTRVLRYVPFLSPVQNVPRLGRTWTEGG